MSSPADRHVVSICLSKDGDARFLGHLDFGRLVDRSLRRSALPVQQTQGFNPRLSLSYTDALPVGLASEGEWIQVRITQDLDPDDVQAMLAPALPEAVRLVDVCKGPPPEVGPVVRYRLEVLGGSRSATDALTALLERDSYSVEDRRRKTPVDVRSMLTDGRADGSDLLVDLSAGGHSVPRPGPVARALEELAAAQGGPPIIFGAFTKLRPGGCRPGEDDTWQDDAVAAAEGRPASSSSIPVRPRRAG